GRGRRVDAVRATGVIGDAAPERGVEHRRAVGIRVDHLAAVRRERAARLRQAARQREAAQKVRDGVSVRGRVERPEPRAPREAAPGSWTAVGSGAEGRGSHARRSWPGSATRASGAWAPGSAASSWFSAASLVASGGPASGADVSVPPLHAYTSGTAPAERSAR